MTDGPAADRPATGLAGAPVRRRARVVLRAGTRLSLRVDRRVVLACALAGLLALLMLALTLTVGQVHVPLREVARAVTGGGNHFDRLIVHRFREPRVLTALLVGACLGMSGAIFQNLAGNPLVSPDIVGINAGAELLIVAVVVVANKPITLNTANAVSLAGSLAAVLLVWFLAVRSGRSLYRLVLIGVGVNTGLGALTTYLRNQATWLQSHQLAGLVGDVANANWSILGHLMVPAVVLLAAGTALGRQLELLQLGETTAVGLGGGVREARLCLLVVGAGLAAISVAAAGSVGFVAFIAPHIARGLARFSGNGILPLSAAVGGALVVVADYAAQRVIEPSQLPVGTMTSLIGGPYFLYLLFRSAKTYAL